MVEIPQLFPACDCKSFIYSVNWCLSCKASEELILKRWKESKLEHGVYFVCLNC